MKSKSVKIYISFTKSKFDFSNFVVENYFYDRNK